MYVFIVNPVAGNGRAKKVFSNMVKESLFYQQNTIYYFTKYKGHATKLIQEIESKYGGKNNIQLIIVIGGDGTIHEVVNGMSNFHVPVAFIPGGSGNDFARGCSISRSPKAIRRNMLQLNNVTPFWIGEAVIEKDRKKKFVNCLGFGFDAVVAASANRIKSMFSTHQMRFGAIIYLFALLKELFSYQSFPLTIEVDGKKHEYSQCFLATINNHPFFGGGMKINPKASNHKERVSILVIDSISKWKVLTLFMTVFTGKHVLFREVKLLEGKEVKVYSNAPIPYQIDGETGTLTSASVMKASYPIKVKGSS